MKKTQYQKTDNPIMVDLPTLQNMLCAGRHSCEKIAEESGAIRKIGRRKYYLVDKIKDYLEKMQDC